MRQLEELGDLDVDFDDDLDDDDEDYDLGEMMSFMEQNGGKGGKDGFLKFMEYQQELSEQGLFMKGGFDAAMSNGGKGGEVVPRATADREVRLEDSEARSAEYYETKGSGPSRVEMPNKSGKGPAG